MAKTIEMNGKKCELEFTNEDRYYTAVGYTNNISIELREDDTPEGEAFVIKMELTVSGENVECIDHETNYEYYNGRVVIVENMNIETLIDYVVSDYYDLFE